MSEKMVLALVHVFMFGIILLMQILLPKVTRKNILLGVKIPEREIKTSHVKDLIRNYQKENLLVGLPLMLVLAFIIFKWDNMKFLLFSSFIYIGILFAVYLRWNKKVKELKMEKEWHKEGKNIVVVDASFSRDKGKIGSIGRVWFLIPILLIIANFVLSIWKYPSLPDLVPSHWDFRGNVDGYMKKSMMTALMMPFTQVFMGLIIYLSYYIMLKSKQQINSDMPEISIKKNIIFRKAWSIYFLMILILLEVIFTLLNMMILGILDDMNKVNILIYFSTGLIIVGAIGLSIAVGQGGDRIRLKEEEDKDLAYDLDDDRLWKLGNSIYYNPDDPSIFVEKRTGVGWTINLGRPLGISIFIMMFVVILVSIFIVR